MVHDLTGQEFAEFVRGLRAHSRSFILSPPQWRTYSLTHPLPWQSVRFDDVNKASVPEERGVYAFVVRHDNSYFPPHGFIMYIGITGSDSARRTLRSRFGEYIQERARKKRPAVHCMLNEYKDDLYFYFAPVPDDAVDLRQVEQALNDAIVPPINKNDFSAEMRAARGAL